MTNKSSHQTGLDNSWSIGIDLGGTKIAVAMVDASGQVLEQRRLATRVSEGPIAIQSEIVDAVLELRKYSVSKPVGVGIGVAGQIDPVSGTVRFAPNLDWRDVPIGNVLRNALDMPVFVTNDVRAATWGEWIHGAGRECDDLVCLFVGTGVGGGVVSGGRMLAGCSNTAGEFGHITIDLHGPLCNCGNRGCLEALAGGWAIARNAREMAEKDPETGAALLRLADGRPERITAHMVTIAYREGDPIAAKIVGTATEALVAGAVSLINALNPCRLILGGGIIVGLPELVTLVDHGVHKRALASARIPLQVLPSRLGNDAGVIGAAIMAMRELTMDDPLQGPESTD